MRGFGWRGLVVLVACAALASACGRRRGEDGRPFEPYLLVWAGDADRRDSDFLAVVNADPSSRKYGKVLATVPVRSSGNEPHELNDGFRFDGRVFGSALLTNKLFVFDLRDPEAPRFGGTTDLNGRRYWAPRGIASLPSGRVVVACPDRANHLGLPREATGAPGGLVELDANGRVLREITAGSDDARGYVVAPSGVAYAPAARTLVTSSHAHGYAVTARGEPTLGIAVQVWKAPQLALLRTVPLEAGPRGEENLGPMTVRAMRKRPVAYVSTHEGGALYVSDSIGIEDPAFRLAYDFGAGSLPVGGAITPDDRHYVAALSGRHQVVLLDLADPLHPRQRTAVRLDRDPEPDGRRAGRPRAGGPGGLAMASDGGRVAVANYTVDVPTYRRDGDRRVYLLRLDEEEGLRIDTAFRDETTDEVGIDFGRTRWPHGATGPARPRGLLFVAAPPSD